MTIEKRRPIIENGWEFGLMLPFYGLIAKTTTMRAGCITLIFFYATALVRAQVINIKANDTDIRYDLIKAAHTFEKVTAFDSTRHIKSEFINENVLQLDSATHRISFIRSRQIPLGYIFTDTSIMINNLPFRFHETSIPAAYEVNVKFNGDMVAVEGLRMGKQTIKNTKMATGYFDDNIVEELFGYFPLEKNKRYHLEAYRYESKGEINPFEFEYVFDDILSGTNGELTACEVIHYINGYLNAYFWIDKKSRSMVKEILYMEKNMDIIQKV